ncbi:ELL-associated factor 2-like [Anneissia japonica]|uniref:ELL-associated factor 2-like n=1 Tax=Anneissia japonica TaxID=1529436 RepID=UPI001425B9A5|nr:ELL-associated factor 2-like [Anneissia japonica]XP_033127370.1 ELL-associated factor 2-like [Anneissia japonica]XP_033127378.1 ELL-associated factor 2-like [Anneissia japonica]
MADRPESILQLFGNKTHSLKLGKSFEKSSGEVYHKLKYDFKPASIDCSQEASLQVEESNKVTVTLNNFEGSVTSHTLYQGSKAPNPKECVLIFDHATGQFTLERLSSSITVKKQRIDGTSKAHLYPRQRVPPVGPTKSSSKKKDKKDVTSQQISKEDVEKVEAALARCSPIPVKQVSTESMASSGSSSAESSDSSSESEESGDECAAKTPPRESLPPASKKPKLSLSGSPKGSSSVHNSRQVNSSNTILMDQLCEDLQLSESSSDSD